MIQNVYAPEILARLGTVAPFCEVVALKLVRPNRLRQSWTKSRESFCGSTFGTVFTIEMDALVPNGFNVRGKHEVVYAL